jgi:hypothetical protein
LTEGDIDEQSIQINEEVQETEEDPIKDEED